MASETFIPLNESQPSRISPCLLVNRFRTESGLTTIISRLPHLLHHVYTSYHVVYVLLLLMCATWKFSLKCLCTLHSFAPPLPFLHYALLVLSDNWKEVHVIILIDCHPCTLYIVHQVMVPPNLSVLKACVCWEHCILRNYASLISQSSSFCVCPVSQLQRTLT